MFITSYHLKVFIICIITLLIVSCSTNTSTNTREANKGNDTQNQFLKPSSKNKGLLKTNGRVCCFDDVEQIEKKLQIELDSADYREVDIMNEIIKYSHLPSQLFIYRGDVNNALATTLDDQRIIIYDKDMFNRIDRFSTSYWSSIFILAHEIGHHLQNNIAFNYPPIKAELEADAFAANVLYKMGADSVSMLAALQSNFIFNETDTKTHPSKGKRIRNALQSWEKAAALTVDVHANIPNVELGFKGFGLNELWTIPTASLGVEPSLLQQSQGIEGIILGQPKLGGGTSSMRDMSIDGYQFTIKVKVTNTSMSSINQLHLKKGDIEEFELYYHPPDSISRSYDAVSQFLIPGRNVRFTAYAYSDMISNGYNMVEIYPR